MIGTLHHEESEFVRHLPCDSCGSSDANSLYTDGHTYCFSCGAVGGEQNTTHREERVSKQLVEVDDYIELSSRGINRETCQKFRYGIGKHKGKTCQIAPYYNEDGLVAQHLRFAGKEFSWVGDAKNLQLFGQHLWKASDKQQYLVITEGEIDCLSVSQVRDNKWATVSLPNGAKSAAKVIKNNYDWVCSFEQIILFFDNDAPGREAMEQCCSILPIGKTRVVKDFPYKDANEALLARDFRSIISAIFDAETYSPEGIVDPSQLGSFLTTEDLDSIPYPFEGLNDLTKGFRQEELVIVTAGSGIGKSTFCRELCYYLLEQQQTVGYIALEESVKKTATSLISLHLNKPHYDVTRVEAEQCYQDWLQHKPIYLFDHFGSLNPEILLDRVRYLVKVKECRWVFIDHLSILVSGLGGGGEREGIDKIMTELRSFVQETGIGMFLVSHLRKADGTAHEMGGQISPTDLRGSHGIFQLADMVIGFEANRQSKSASEKLMLTPRVLKNRFSGEVGLCEPLKFVPETGRLTQSSSYGFTDETEDEEFEDDSY